jgi:hypothetical protein
MKRATLSLATGVILASASAVLAPAAASAATGPLAGTWTSIDTDGSNQTLDITGSGRHAYSMVYLDESATSACGGNPAQLSGSGFVDGSDLLMVATLVCLPGGNDFRTRLTITFVYDTGTDTLTDAFGIVWHRAS